MDHIVVTNQTKTYLVPDLGTAFLQVVKNANYSNFLVLDVEGREIQVLKSMGKSFPGCLEIVLVLRSEKPLPGELAGFKKLKLYMERCQFGSHPGFFCVNELPDRLVAGHRVAAIFIDKRLVEPTKG